MACRSALRRDGRMRESSLDARAAVMSEQPRHQALHDRLTGLPNRGLLYRKLERAIRDAGGREADCALIVLDLDRFKDINASLGHLVGDNVLRQVGRSLQGTVLATDLVARLGGDEFAVLLPQADAARAVRSAEDLAHVLQNRLVLESQSIAVDASFGIAVAPQHGQDADTLLRRAEVAMYQAKRSGLGVALYSGAGENYRPDRLALAGELRQAIERDELVLHYQPKLDLHDGSLVGLEAVVRLQHARRGLLPPSEFIPLAELSGLIRPLTLWVLEAALRQQHAWRDLGLEVPVAINLSRRMLHDPQLPDTVAGVLARWDVPPSCLVLEITESSLMAVPLRAAENLKQLRAHGVRVSIDDFGTGYSSLDSLKVLPVDELKIDRSFVRAMATDASARAIVRAIIDLADALKLRVVAEGVEDQATWDVLASLGCDVAQGYFVSPPLAADELEAWVSQVAPAWLDSTARSGVNDVHEERIRARGAHLTAEEEFVARKRAESALRTSEERTRLALEAAHMGTWAWDSIADGLTWSAETEALHGLAPGTFDGTVAATRRTVHPDDWAGVEAEVEAALAERRESVTIYRTVWPDGSVHWIEDKGRGVYAPDGTTLRVTGTSMDITERKLAEEALSQSEERFRKQYKGFPLPTFSWLDVGDDFVLEDYNDAAAALIGGAEREWLGTRASARYADRPDIIAALRASVAEQRTLRREVRYRFAATGGEREFAFTYVFVAPQTVMIHAEDITDARQAEQQREVMAQSEKLRALGQMATGIAHDLNQSLMLVASYSDLARQALIDNPPNLADALELLTTTTQAALDGGETVKRLLLFTRAAPEPHSQAVDLSKAVRDAATLTAPRWRDAAQGEGLRISLDIETQGHPTIHGSPAQLRELMTNLIFNAVDALPRGGTIRLRVLAEDGQGIIEVTDSGVGMSAEVQARVFEPFFTTKGERGTGLGLAMVFGIVEQHGGHIELRSEPGNGTTFRITLPLVEASVESDPSNPPAARLGPRRPLRVLAVDDEPMIARAVVRMLRPAGHVVSVAASAEEALEKLADQTFDVVVSDVGLGSGMNGWELANAVKQRWPGVHFLLATGWGATIDPREARARGVEAVLSKPYHPTDLIQALARTEQTV